MEMENISQQLRFSIKSKKDSVSYSNLILLLTFAPRLGGEFGASERQSRKAKQLVNECGISTYPNKKKR